MKFMFKYKSYERSYSSIIVTFDLDLIFCLNSPKTEINSSFNSYLIPITLIVISSFSLSLLKLSLL